MTDDLYTQFDNIFFERTRLSLLTLIRANETVSFTFLRKRIGGSDGALYTHLEKLIQAGYLVKERDTSGKAVKTNYSITASGREKYNEYLLFLREVLNTDGRGKGEEAYETDK